jgi:hypothetical protein
VVIVPWRGGARKVSSDVGPIGRWAKKVLKKRCLKEQCLTEKAGKKWSKSVVGSVFGAAGVAKKRSDTGFTLWATARGA